MMDIITSKNDLVQPSVNFVIKINQQAEILKAFMVLEGFSLISSTVRSQLSNNHLPDLLKHLNHCVEMLDKNPNPNPKSTTKDQNPKMNLKSKGSPQFKTNWSPLPDGRPYFIDCETENANVLEEKIIVWVDCMEALCQSLTAIQKLFETSCAERIFSLILAEKLSARVRAKIIEFIFILFANLKIFPAEEAIQTNENQKKYLEENNLKIKLSKMTTDALRKYFGEKTTNLITQNISSEIPQKDFFFKFLSNLEKPSDTN